MCIRDRSRILQINMPDIIQEFSRQAEYEDVIYSLNATKTSDYDKTIVRGMLQAGLRAARQIGDRGLVSKLAYELSLSYLDREAWEILNEVDVESATRVLRVLAEFYTPGSDEAADQMLLHGWSLTGHKNELLVRLKSIGDMNLVMRYDDQLKDCLLYTSRCV